MLKFVTIINEEFTMTFDKTVMKRKPTHPGEMLREDFCQITNSRLPSLQELWAYRVNLSMNSCGSVER